MKLLLLVANAILLGACVVAAPIVFPTRDGGGCVVPLSSIPCPASVDAVGTIDFFSSARCPQCRNTEFGCPRTGSCESHVTYEISTGYDTLRCYYDAASGSLVAGLQCTDTDRYCGGFCQYGGASVGACPRGPRVTACPGDRVDGGPMDGRTDVVPVEASTLDGGATDGPTDVVPVEASALDGGAMDAPTDDVPVEASTLDGGAMDEPTDDVPIEVSTRDAPINVDAGGGSRD